jgi:topoisomerase IA-like protein
MTEVKFQVGEIYSNRIGQYKVINIDQASGRMDVCYIEGGETKSLDMTIQSRICRNMQLDARIDEANRLEEANAAAKASKPARATAKAKAASKKAAPKKASSKKTAAATAADPALPGD